MALMFRWLVGLGKGCAGLGALVAVATGLLTTVSVVSPACCTDIAPTSVRQASKA